MIAEAAASASAEILSLDLLSADLMLAQEARSLSAADQARSLSAAALACHRTLVLPLALIQSTLHTSVQRMAEETPFLLPTEQW